MKKCACMTEAVSRHHPEECDSCFQLDILQMQLYQAPAGCWAVALKIVLGASPAPVGVCVSCSPSSWDPCRNDHSPPLLLYNSAVHQVATRGLTKLPNLRLEEQGGAK